MSEEKDKNPIQVADRLFGALEYLASNGATGLTDLAGALSLNKSTMHRILVSLQYMGYVRQNDNADYELTFKIVDLAHRLMEHTDVAEKVRPYLKKLMEQTSETVHFVQLDGTDVVYIDKVEAYQNNVRMVSHIGMRIPFYRSAVGKALAAAMPEPEVKKLWNASRIERTTPYTITNYDEFKDALEEVRRKGYALDNEENEQGVRCIGVALDIPEGAPRYAVSISVPIGRMDNDRIRELSVYILKAKADIDAAFRSTGAGA